MDNINTIKDMMGQFMTGMEQLKQVTSGPVDIGQPLTILQNAFNIFQGMVNEELVKMGQRMRSLEDRQDNLEQYSRRNCLLFRGLEEKNGSKEDEDVCLKLVMNVMKNQLKVDLPDTVVERCHRLGAKKSESGPRPIIVKFWSYRYRRQVFVAKRALKGSGVVVTEFLTQSRLQVLNKARDLHGAQNTWTSDGKVHIKILMSDGKEKRVVATQAKDVPSAASVKGTKAPESSSNKPANSNSVRTTNKTSNVPKPPTTRSNSANSKM